MILTNNVVFTISERHTTKPLDCLLAMFTTLRATLHLEAGAICCVRGLKSSLVIGQKAQIGPQPFYT
jgi:hypothetical protein